MSDRIQKIEVIAGIIISIIIVYFHVLFMLNAGGLWRDEVTTLNLAAMPTFSDLWKYISYDSFPILSALLLRLWIGIEWLSNDIGIRCFGLIVGVAVLVVLWRNSRLFGNRLPIVSMMLFGFSSPAIRNIDSIRPYGLGILLILLAFGMIWKVVRSPSSARVATAGIVSVLSVQCLYTNAVLLFAIILSGITVLLMNKMWKRAALLAGIGMVSALSMAPYIKTIRAAQEWIFLIQSTYDLRHVMEKLASALSASGDITLWAWAGLFILAIIIAVYRCLKDDGQERNISIYSATCMMLALITYTAFLLYMNVSIYPRHFLPMLAVIAISMDTVVGINGKYLALSRIAAAVLVIIMTFVPNLNNIQIRQTNIDLIASKLERSVSKDDIIVVNPWYCGITFKRYYNGDAEWLTVPPIEDLSVHRYDLFKKQMMAVDPLQPVFSKVIDTLKAGNRVWFIGGLPHLPEGSLPPHIPPAPNELSGWDTYPYLMGWAMQTTYFIQTRALHQSSVDMSAGQDVNRYETLPLEVAEGWRGK